MYSKSKVYVHPTSSAKDNIPGFIALIQQKSSPLEREVSPRPASSSSQTKNASSYLLAWVPESSLGDAYSTYVKVDLSEGNSPPRQTYLVPPLPTTTQHSDNIGMYAFAVPVSEIYSLLVRPPSLGWWFGSVVINTKVGDSFPALFFHDSECESTILQRKKRAKESFDPFGEEGGLFWGGDEVLRWLKRYVTVERSGADPNVYLINPSDDDKKSFGPPLTTDNSGRTVSKKGEAAGPSNQRQPPRDAGMDPFTKALKETRWRFLEQLSKVTTFTRRTAQDIADNPKLPPQVRRLMKNPEVQTLQDEFDSARIYLARWAMGIAEQSERERNQRIFTANDMLEMEDSAVGEFEILDMEAGKMSLSDRRKPVNINEWNQFFDPSNGRLQVTPDEVIERIFHGGLDPDDGVRKEAWLFLLGVYDWQSTADERRALINSKRDEFIRLKGAWWERMVEGSSTAEEHEWWKEQKGRIGEDIPHPDPDSPFADSGTNVHMEQMKDMLLTYNEYNRSLGYVQGMSDLLSPIYAVMQDDAVAFWAFVGFMSRMERNFLRDQSGMRAQLLALDQLVQLLDPQLYLHLESADSTNFFFFFRMLLVWYKREFEWADTLRLWEILWTDYQSSQFHLFVAVAILERHRDVIIQHLKHFDEILKFINELSGRIDLPSTLVKAEQLFRRFEKTVEAVDKQNHFPAPSSIMQSASPLSPTASKSPISDNHTTPNETPPVKRHPPPRRSREWANRANNKPGPSSRQEHPTSSAQDKQKIITPELRALLSRKVITMDNTEVERHGGGTA
ncbi:putative gtpase-activating protein gyp7 [Phaeomoniella chlamydospora]|uniref:GTPase-activating protein GYP7 n=1 Tax=Phaeomoniella chlamydospora TaxID=158046 RepID=A0A0G2EGH2_PHACM|nr:putative gtpase-activating protein gyp7 [Phaeomoniella chlamydospora]